jgi:hypothetical protein
MRFPRNNGWKYSDGGKRADYYDEDGKLLGFVFENKVGDCTALYRDSPSQPWAPIGGSNKLYYIEAKQLIEMTVRMNQ